MRFLLLDNDANFRRALAIALRLDGMTVFEAEDPQEAEKLLESQTFDAVVLHLHVPGPHLDFIARLRARLPDCRVVVCNAHQEILDAARAAGFGPVLELRRPFGAKELLERLRQ